MNTLNLLVIFSPLCYGQIRHLNLNEVDKLTFHADKLTQTQNSVPIPQLICSIEKSECSKRYQPKKVECFNKGFNGTSFRWECHSSMDPHYSIDNISIICEPTIKKNIVIDNSCSLNYSLSKNPSRPVTRHLLSFIIIGLIFWYIKDLPQTQNYDYAGNTAPFAISNLSRLHRGY